MPVVEDPTLVRREWAYELAAASQRFVGGLVAPWPGAFPEAVNRFLGGLPTAGTRAEDMHLRTLLSAIAERTARCYHDMFHRSFTGQGCAAIPTALWAPWLEPQNEAAAVFRGWSERYDAAFAAAHQWPAAVRAAIWIERHPGRPPDATALAHSLLTSRSRLTHRFREMFDLSLGEYYRRVRMRSAIRMVRTSASVDAVASECGFKQPESFYRAFHDATGLTPSAIRDLPQPVVDELLRHRFALAREIAHPNIARGEAA
jgi:AraC-like DNA-binding protein